MAGLRTRKNSHHDESASSSSPLRVRTILLTYLAVDLVFKFSVLPAYLDLGFGLGTPRCTAAFLKFLPLVGVMVLTWFAGLGALLYPVVKWHRTPAEERTPDAIRKIAKTTRRLPQRLGLWWTLEWFTLCSTFTIIESGPSLAASLFFLSAMMLGPWPLGHGLGVSLLGSTVREISLLARVKGVELNARPQRLMPKLAAYCLCIALAPTGYLASLVVNPSTHGLGSDHWIKSVAIFCGAIVLFAALSAVLLAQTITKPASEMGDVMRVLIAQGDDVSEVARLPVYQRDEVGMLAEQTNRMLDRLEATAKGRAGAAASLEALNETLEERVRQRTEELSVQTREMRLVLDNVAEGLFAVPRSGVLPLEISHSLIGWFGVPAIGETFYRYMGRSVPGFERNAEVGWMQVNEDVFPLEIALDQMPKRIKARGKHLRISYEPIVNDPDGRILIVITDETSLVEHENAEIERRETLALLDHYISERGVFLEFMEEASALVALVRPASCDLDDASGLKRAIHTLKGNAMSFGLESIARICHDIESAMAENLPASVVQALFASLDERWLRLENRIERVGGKQRRMVEITPDDHAALENAIRGGAPRQQLMQMVKAMKLEPVSIRLNHLAEQARRISARLDKSVQVDVVDDGLKVDASRWAKLWPAIVHPVRNAIDHGIESASERAQNDKPESGRIILRSEREGDKIVIAIEDDGRGIEWSAIAAKCKARGIEVSSQEDLHEALFVDGLSTAKSVNDISGRGVGMGALRETVESLGGTLAIVTKPNQGTSLRMAFPAKQEELSSSLRPAAA
jgi:HPt (histidine-containing phosphotransfer) domain-containing protein